MTPLLDFHELTIGETCPYFLFVSVRIQPHVLPVKWVAWGCLN